LVIVSEQLSFKVLAILTKESEDILLVLIIRLPPALAIRTKESVDGILTTPFQCGKIHNLFA